MSHIPETQYVTVGDSDVAYKVLGEGPLDLLYVGGLGSHVDLLLNDGRLAGWHALSSFSRLIFFDRRGTGASDRFALNAMPTWEDWTDDVRAVLDAVGSDKAALFASLDAGPIAMLFASIHPTRVSALVLANTSARFLVDDDYPIGASRETLDSQVDLVRSLWGKPDLIRFANPAVAEDAELGREFARRLRAAATPHTAAAQYRYIMESLDVRRVLPLIQAPTLVVHTSHNPLVPPDHGRYIAEHVAGARFIEVPGRGVSLNDGLANTIVLDEISQLLTGQRPPLDIDRVLTTVLFTDMIASTERAAALGDARWHRLLDAHDRAVREQLRRFRGREVNTTGDGFFVSFDGPARAIRCAQAIIAVARDLDVKVRVGIHSGECEIRGDDLAGLAVHVAARVGAFAGAGEVLVSRTVVDLVAGSGISFTDRGDHDLKGVPGTWRLFAVTP
jgi:class 3 adenylate cyclase/pimeloyl-ACP methyl ester carboxylesterase